MKLDPEDHKAIAAEVVALIRETPSTDAITRVEEVRARYNVRAGSVSVGVSVSPKLNYTTIYVHADEKCESDTNGSLPEILAKLDAEFASLTPESRAKELRDKAAKLLADANEIAPARKEPREQHESEAELTGRDTRSERFAAMDDADRRPEGT